MQHGVSFRSIQLQGNNLVGRRLPSTIARRMKVSEYDPAALRLKIRSHGHSDGLQVREHLLPDVEIPSHFQPPYTLKYLPMRSKDGVQNSPFPNPQWLWFV
jgi:hypothetical protein